LLAGLALLGGVGLVALAGGRPTIVPGTTRLLLIGDSHAEGLAPPLGALAADQHVPFKAVYLRGSRIDQWASSTKLTDALQSFHPTLVLISLGTNDEYMQGTDVPARQRPYAEQLLQKLRAAGAEIVWVGPPRLPRPTNGIQAMLQQVAPAYFPSHAIDIQQGPDRIHATARGYAGWAGALWQWLA
jgi:lysophospholipase L1-like esterase